MATQLAEQPDTPADEPQTEAPRDYRTEALALGWVPAEDFKGDPDRHVDEETFVKRGEEQLPLVKKRVEVMARQIADLEKTLARATALLSTSEKRSYERAVAELKARQDEAVEIGDVAANRRLTDEIDKLKSEIKADAADARIYTPEEARDAFVDWREDNQWYDRGSLASASELEANARAYAERMSEKHMSKAETMAPDEFFSFIGGLVVEKYPLLKAKAQRAKPASDVSAPTLGRNGGGAKGYADLPADARQICDSLIRRGVLPGKSETEKRAFYANNYDWTQK